MHCICLTMVLDVICIHASILLSLQISGEGANQMILPKLGLPEGIHVCMYVCMHTILSHY